MISWNDLPASVQDAVQGHVGPISAAAAVRGGQNSDIAAVLHRDTALPVFLKGVRGVSRRMRWLRNETIAAPLTGGLSPGVLFAEDVEEWLVVGFEHVTGRAASLAPGSPDLALVAEAVNRIGTQPGGSLRPLRDRWSVTDWWHKLAIAAPDVVDGWDVDAATRWARTFPELARGDRLAHTDLHGEQFLIDHDEVRVIDWGYPGCGAPWVDAAFIVLRLIEAGHHPGEAERWARAHLVHFTDGEHLTAFAMHIAGLWGYWAATGDISGAPGRAQLARTYAAWRCGAGRSSG
ncbi:hypothetical protein F1721_28780 [Saccharopolyspora hirsuta]|uniref:Uncharacterized protein n=1 Tax=Saccharopolyspora hirsuta TaxID=1837 RepID=A0A5M7BK04_SACHI|nr:phosphotransferase [Saccharopolyspora hirsuta]KAA5828437.1 hypothetical protein F1721_28780 [Saccharopolyspora hirsuta]